MTTAALIQADFVYPNFDHQTEEFEFHSDDGARAWAWTMRTGKSKAAIDKACHLYAKRHKIDGVLIFAPNGVHANWIEVEFPKHTWPGVVTDPLVWRSQELSTKRRNDLSKADLDLFEIERLAWFATIEKAKHSSNLMVLAINTESMTRDDVRRAVAFFIARRRVFVIFDESDDFGVPGTKRTKMARALAIRCPYRMILSGTMLTGSPLAAWSQFELLKRGALGFETYKEFKYHFADYEIKETATGRRYPNLIGFKNLDELRERMAPFTSVVLREDVKDMPALHFEPRAVIPTDEQMEVYRELHHSICVEVGDEEISIGELANRLGKLQQVFSGFLIDEFKDVHEIPGDNPRLDLLSRELFLAPGKVIVWCQFQHDIDQVTRRLTLEGHKVVQYHGRVSNQVKSESLKAFRDDDEVTVLVGHIKAGGRGVDMSKASTIIVYSHTFSARFRKQAMDRATKIGGGNILVLDFIAPGPDKYMLSVTEGRVQIADSLIGGGMQKLLGELAL